MSQEYLHKGIQDHGHGAKETFTKGSKALAKEPRGPPPRSQEGLRKGAKKVFTKGSKALAKEAR